MNYLTLSPEIIKNKLNYNIETGQFTWRLNVGSHGRIKSGTIAGNPFDNGYWQIKLNGKHYQAHRLAWAYVTGEWPKNHIDHINGIKNDNRFCNLRDVSISINAQNQRKPRTDNKCGFLGVFCHQTKTKTSWRARIKINGKAVHIGLFKTPELAHEAYLSAKRKYHEGCTI